MSSASKIVCKFGGTSMGSAEAMLKSAEVVLERKASVVVVSATSGTTNLLIDTAIHAQKAKPQEVEQNIQIIIEKHLSIAKSLNSDAETLEKLTALFGELKAITQGILLLAELSVKAMDRIQSLGERLSSLLFVTALKNAIKKNNTTQKVQWVDIRTVIKTDDQFGKARPLMELTVLNAQKYLKPQEGIIYVSQGFIGETVDGQTTTLGRGGSDYSGAIIAEAIRADWVEIWTDVSGIATTDPRICPQAKMLPEMSFQEASELATFGAKVLHPATLVPAINNNIPVYVANTFAPGEGGTWVRAEAKEKPLIRAIALRKNQTLMTLSTPDMLNTHGFLFKIFKIFNDHKISVDAITTSEISVSMTLEQNAIQNKNFFSDLEAIADVKVEENFSLVAIIGNNIDQTSGLAQGMFSCLSDINIRMICMGASRHNVCILVSEKYGAEVVQRLHKKFLE